MNKTNVFQSSNFYMADGDVLHMLIQDEGGSYITMELFGELHITPEARNEGLLVDYDGNEYTTIVIGNQEWMVENLKTTHYNNGTAIPPLILDADWFAEDGTLGHNGGYCWYDNITTNKTSYGALYNWYAVGNINGLAPTGWRIPSTIDFTALFTFLGGVDVAGGKLKEIGLSHWTTPNAEATDEYGFMSLPAGDRENTGPFNSLLLSTYYWSSTEVNPTTATPYMLDYGGGSVATSATLKRLGYSVRCMRDYSI